MTRRSRGREVALQVLYQVEQNPGMSPDEIRRFIQRRLLEDRKLCEFTEGLVDGVKEHQAQIDTMIAQVAENWRLDRMAAIDRNILRLGAYEMLFRPEVPAKVAINEALELAKRYSTAQSSRFVNGILDRVLQCQIQETTPQPNPEAEPGGRARARAGIAASSNRRRMKPNPHKARRHDVAPAVAARPSRWGRSARAHDAFRRGLLAVRGGCRRGEGRPGGTGDHRPRHGLGPGGRPTRGRAVGH